MIPDRRYRIVTRRLFVACWVMAFGLAGLGGLLIGRWTGAGTILLIMAIGCLRLAREVRDEMDRWGSFTPPPERATSITWYGDRYDRTPLGWQRMNS